MEIKIGINKYNKDKILKLLDALVEAETTNQEQSKQPKPKIEESTDKTANEEAYRDYARYFDRPISYPNELLLESEIQPAKFGLGTNFLFNSFFAAKAMLRAIANRINEKKAPVSIEESLKTFFDATKARGLQEYKGFPKEREQKHEGSAENRPLYSIIFPLSELGFLRIEDKKIYLTKAGLDFAMLNNPKLDQNAESFLSEEETSFITDHLKQIDKEGYKEYTLLKSFIDYIKERQLHNKAVSYHDLTKYFFSNQEFVDYLYENSKFGKKNLPKESHDFVNRVKRESQAIASSKISILRELGVLESKRNSYSILKNW